VAACPLRLVQLLAQRERVRAMDDRRAVVAELGVDQPMSLRMPACVARCSVPWTRSRGAVQVAEGVGGAIFALLDPGQALQGEGLAEVIARSVRTARVSAAGAGTRRRTGRIRAWPDRGSTAPGLDRKRLSRRRAALSAVSGRACAGPRGPDGEEDGQPPRPVARSTARGRAGQRSMAARSTRCSAAKPGQCAVVVGVVLDRHPG